MQANLSRLYLADPIREIESRCDSCCQLSQIWRLASHAKRVQAALKYPLLEFPGLTSPYKLFFQGHKVSHPAIWLH